ncbi:MAG: PilT/PilU family type 4a pilus ATPase [Lachnospiraceae bacterium]|nr:PilT/PilU family type 4a pilus ATPase [Lachnospiraceae bacterium]
MKSIEELIRTGKAAGASDVHIAANVPVKYRIDGQLTNLDADIISPDDCENYAKELSGRNYDKIRDIGEWDGSDTIAGERIRINAFRAAGHVSLALRILADHIPELDSLGLPPVVSKFSAWEKGIVLVTGETGSGKSTTLAAILNQINHSRREHIITLEDPIEYVYQPDLCLINQREIGTDTESYANGLRAILREDPDVILIGEMRDTETMETAMTAAETGHLVFATLHTNSAVDSVDRIVGSFPADKQPQISMQLSTTLKAVLSQQLLVRKGGKGRVCACEAMIVNQAIKNQIREGNTPQMQSSLLSSADIGSLTMDNCLINQVRQNLIDPETAIAAAFDPDFVERNVGHPVTSHVMPQTSVKRRFI